MQDILKVVGINSKGFGTIPKLVMQDRKLTPEAKCIYAYFASYAGAGTNAFPSVSKILYDLKISESRYYRHFKLLTIRGYLKVEQAKNNNGRFSHNIYTMNTEISPSPQIECTENACTENEGTNINNLKNNNINKRKYIKEKKTKTKKEKKNKYEGFYL